MKIMYNDKVVSNTITAYETLSGKPMINSVVLTGNKTSGELNMYSKPQIDAMFASMRSIKVVPTIPTVPIANTMYYVGESAPYRVYLYDSNRERIDLGESDSDLTQYQRKIDGELQTSTTNVVGAINEVNAHVGLPENLTTTVKNNTVEAINEVNKNVGQPTNLTTTAKTNTVAAINELKTQVDKKQEMIGKEHPYPVVIPFGQGSKSIAAGTRYKLFSYTIPSAGVHAIVRFSMQTSTANTVNAITNMSTSTFELKIYCNASDVTSQWGFHEVGGGRIGFLDNDLWALAITANEAKTEVTAWAVCKVAQNYPRGRCIIESAFSTSDTTTPFTWHNGLTANTSFGTVAVSKLFYRGNYNTSILAAANWSWLKPVGTYSKQVTTYADFWTTIHNASAGGCTRIQAVWRTISNGDTNYRVHCGNLTLYRPTTEATKTLVGMGDCIINGKRYALYAVDFTATAFTAYYLDDAGSFSAWNFGSPSTLDLVTIYID